MSAERQRGCSSRHLDEVAYSRRKDNSKHEWPSAGGALKGRFCRRLRSLIITDGPKRPGLHAVGQYPPSWLAPKSSHRLTDDYRHSLVLVASHLLGLQCKGCRVQDRCQKTRSLVSVGNDHPTWRARREPKCSISIISRPHKYNRLSGKCGFSATVPAAIQCYNLFVLKMGSS